MKLIIKLCSLAILIAATSCSPPSQSRRAGVKRTTVPRGTDLAKVKTTHADCRYFSLSTLSAIKADNNSIVVGRPTQGFVDRSHLYTILNQPFDPLDRDSASYLNEAWSEGSFVVDQVLYARPGDPISAGQTIRYAEPVGLVTENGNIIKTVEDNCRETKQNSRYVMVLDRHSRDGVYWLVNLNEGRFNTDGTDAEDEVNAPGGVNTDGTKTRKQTLREELTAAYGVAFGTLPGPGVVSHGFVAPNVGTPPFGAEPRNAAHARRARAPGEHRRAATGGHVRPGREAGG